MPRDPVTSSAARAILWGNRLLSALPPDEHGRLEGHLKHMHLPKDKVLLSPGDKVAYAYFPLDGVVSLLMVLEDGTPVEVANIGNEGFASVESMLSADRSPYEVT